MKLPQKYTGILHLAALLILVPLLAYTLSVRHTISSWRAYRLATQELRVLSPDSRWAGGETAPVSVQQIPTISLLLNQLWPFIEQEGGEVERYTPIFSQPESDYVIHTSEVTLRGAYIPLVRIIDDIEKKLPGCKLRSVGFRLVKPNFKQKNSHLELTLLVQHISR